MFEDNYKCKRARREIDALIERSQFGSALDKLDDHLETYPQDANALLRLGRVLHLLSRYSESEETLIEAQYLYAFDSHWIVCQELGHLYRKWGRLEMALSHYERITILWPSRVSGHVWRGQVLSQLGRFEDAAESHQLGTLGNIGGSIDWAFYHLGLVRRSQERYEEAKTCFASALALDPNYDLAAMALADIEALLPCHLWLVQ